MGNNVVSTVNHVCVWIGSNGMPGCGALSMDITWMGIAPSDGRSWRLIDGKQWDRWLCTACHGGECSMVWTE